MGSMKDFGAEGMMRRWKPKAEYNNVDPTMPDGSANPFVATQKGKDDWAAKIAAKRASLDAGLDAARAAEGGVTALMDARRSGLTNFTQQGAQALAAGSSGMGSGGARIAASRDVAMNVANQRGMFGAQMAQGISDQQVAAKDMMSQAQNRVYEAPTGGQESQQRKLDYMASIRGLQADKGRVRELPFLIAQMASTEDDPEVKAWLYEQLKQYGG